MIVFQFLTFLIFYMWFNILSYNHGSLNSIVGLQPLINYVRNVLAHFGHETTLSFHEIYPDATVEEIEQKMVDLTTGDLCIDDVINDAWEEGVDIDWEWLDEDDWWTDRKGGYDVTYAINEDE